MSKKVNGLRPHPALEASITETVARLRSHPRVPSRIPISGYIDDVRSGRLIEVQGAAEYGKAA